MIPATTPTFIIKIKNQEHGYLEDSVSLRVDIRQQDILLSKYTDELTVDLQSNSITVTLSQKQSAKFLYKNGNIEFQVHGLLGDGTSWKTKVMSVSVEKTLSKEIIK